MSTERFEQKADTGITNYQTMEPILAPLSDHRKANSDRIDDLLMTAAFLSDSEFENTLQLEDQAVKSENLNASELKHLQDDLLDDLSSGNKDTIFKYANCILKKLPHEGYEGRTISGAKFEDELKSVRAQSGAVSSVMANYLLEHTTFRDASNPHWFFEGDEKWGAGNEIRKTEAYERFSTHPDFDKIATIPAGITPQYIGNIEEGGVVDRERLQKDVNDKRKEALECWSKMTDGTKILQADELKTLRYRYAELQDLIHVERYISSHKTMLAGIDGQVRISDLTHVSESPSSPAGEPARTANDTVIGGSSQTASPALSKLNPLHIVDLLMECAASGNASEYGNLVRQLDETMKAEKLSAHEVEQLENQIADDVFTANPEAAAMLGKSIVTKMPAAGSGQTYIEHRVEPWVNSKDFESALKSLYRQGDPIAGALARCLYRSRAELILSQEDISPDSIDRWAKAACGKIRQGKAYESLKAHPGFDRIASLHESNARPQDISEIEYGQSVDSAKLKSQLDESRKQLVDAWQTGNMQNYYTAKDNVQALRFLQTHIKRMANSNNGELRRSDL